MLLAIVNVAYEFYFVDAGKKGQLSAGGTFNFRLIPVIWYCRNYVELEVRIQRRCSISTEITPIKSVHRIIDYQVEELILSLSTYYMFVFFRVFKEKDNIIFWWKCF